MSKNIVVWRAQTPKPQCSSSPGAYTASSSLPLTALLEYFSSHCLHPIFLSELLKKQKSYSIRWFFNRQSWAFPTDYKKAYIYTSTKWAISTEFSLQSAAQRYNYYLFMLSTCLFRCGKNEFYLILIMGTYSVFYWRMKIL